MKLLVKPVTATSSREEVFFDRKKRRRGHTQSGPEFGVYRVPELPPPSAEALALHELRAELGLSGADAGRALGLRAEQFAELETGKLTVADPTDWPKARAALEELAASRTAEREGRW